MHRKLYRKSYCNYSAAFVRNICIYMNFYVMTLFPDMIMNCISESITGRAIDKGVINVKAVNIRDYTNEKHGHVDDYPYGGGVGMVMQAQPIYDCYKAVLGMIDEGNSGHQDCANAAEAGVADAKSKQSKQSKQSKPYVRTLYMTPQGRPFDQKYAEELSKEENLVFLCGHYEGVDERALELLNTENVSIGDYVLTGGELPALSMIDCISRLVPGVLGKDESAYEESFSNNLLEYPQYTRPEEFMGKRVPDVLLSGHHANVDKWRRERSIERTLKVRPDLLEGAVLDKKEKKFLDKLKAELSAESAGDLENVTAGESQPENGELSLNQQSDNVVCEAEGTGLPEESKHDN